MSWNKSEEKNTTKLLYRTHTVLHDKIFRGKTYAANN